MIDPLKFETLASEARETWKRQNLARIALDRATLEVQNADKAASDARKAFDIYVRDTMFGVVP